MKKIILFAWILITYVISYGQFVENRGQVVDFNQDFHPEVKFYYGGSDASVYFQDDRVVYNFIEKETIDFVKYDNDRAGYEEALRQQKATYHRMDMVFQNAELNPNFSTGKQMQGVTHYYLNKRNGIRDVRSFESFRYENIYPNIDAVFYYTANGLKYDLVLKSGANINDIRLKFEGANVQIKDEKLVISTSFKDLTEEIPLSFINGDSKNVVAVDYILNNDGTVGFRLKNKITYSTLTIDPVLEWCTYYNQGLGGSDYLGYISNHLDDNGNYFSYGMSPNAANAYPVVGPGSAYTTTHNGSADAYIMKFKPDRSLEWATYLGGSGYEELYGDFQITSSGNILHVVGERITAGAPFTNGGGYYANTVNRNFWARFNISTGALIHLTSLSSGYRPNIAVSKNSGNVAIINDAYDSNNLPVMNRAGAYNQANSGGFRDMGLLMFNSSYNQIWGTFLGGPGSQEGYMCTFDNNDNLYFAGGSDWLTASNPTTEKLQNLAGAYNKTIAEGGTNVSFGKFDANGALVWHTLYGGNVSDGRVGQQGIRPQITINPYTNDVILAFNTTSNNLPLQNMGGGAYYKGVPTDPDFSGGGSYWNYAAYIAIFNTNGVRNHGTYYYTGNGGGDLIQNIAFGGCNKMYVGSTGMSTRPLTGASSGYNLLLGTSSSRSGYITMLDATNYGFEWDSYINTNVSYEAFVAANTNFAPFYTTTKLWYNNLPTVDPGGGAYFEGTSSDPTSSGLDIAQFHPSLPPTLTNQTICAGQTVNLTASSGMGAPYNWYTSPGSSTPVHTGSTYNVSPGSTTTYYVSSGTGMCASPKAPVTVTVNPGPNAGTMSGTPSMCVGSTSNFSITGGDSGGTWASSNPTAASVNGSGVVTANATGTATITYTVNGTGGCPNAVAQITVTVNSIPAAPTASNQSFCGSGTVGNLVPSGTGYTWHANASTPGILLPGTALTNGNTYYVQQTVNGCASPRTPVTVTITPIPSAPMAANQSFCGSATVANLTASGSNIQWYSSASGGTPLSSGTALTNGGTYYASQTVSGCESTRTPVTVTITPIPSAPMAANQSFCGSATVANLTASGSNIQWYSSASGGTPLSSGTALTNGGTYYASQTVSGCESTRTSVTVTITPIPSAPTTTSQSFCGSATVANLTASGSNIQWYANASGGSPLSSGTALTNGGTYYATQTVGGCESPRIAISVTITPIPSAPTATNQSFCGGATVGDLTAGGSNIQWYSSASGGSPLSNGTALTNGGTYYTSQTVNGCESTRQSITVTINTPANAGTISGSTAVCQGGTINLSTNGDTGGSWSVNNGNATVSNGVVTGVNSGSVTVTYTVNGSGACPNSTANYSITVNSLPTVSVTGDNITCNGLNDGSASVTVTGNGGYTYTWSPNVSTGSTATGLAPGSYSVTVNDVNGCSETKSIVISQPAAIVLNASVVSDATCGGNDGSVTVNASGGTGGFTYSWNDPNNQTSATASNLGAGTYIVTVTDASGCSNTASVVISNTSGPSVTLNLLQALSCNGDSDAILESTVTGGQTPYTYSWSNGANSGTAINLGAGTYTLSVTDADGCLTAESYTVTEPDQIAMTFATTDANCGSSDGSATVTPTGGTGAYTYSWNDPNNQTTATATNMAAGTYTVEITDANGCSQTDDVTIANPSAPTLNISTQQNVNCDADETGSVTVSATGGTGNYTYSWMPNVSTSNSATDLGVGTYEVTVTDDAGCSTPITINITANNPTPTVIANAVTSVLCEGEDILLQGAVANGGSNPTYIWTGPNGYTGVGQNQTIPNATVNAGGEYSFVVIGAGGCTSDTATVDVTVYAKPVAIASADETSVCEGGTLTLIGDGGAAYLWTGPNGFTSNEQNPTIANVTLNEGGTYTLTVISSDGCESDAATVQIVITPASTSSGYIETTMSVCVGENVTLQVTNPDSSMIYTWIFDDNSIGQGTSMTFSPISLDDRGAYLIYGAENGNCSAVVEIIKLNVEACNVTISETFSPNGDGTNDYFFIDNIELYPNTELWIYSRWGLEVFHSDNYNNDWDGTSQNKLNIGKDIVPEGTYYYFLKLGGAEDNPNAGKEYKGFVYLKR
ncbi:MAG: gliding motility-associated C-terminal domain-containing protein [Brumimicrobium sp.]|nr:gliding motility-associated C-terminal domain-containing protein [Brumimicrobium sp.]